MILTKATAETNDQVFSFGPKARVGQKEKPEFSVHSVAADNNNKT